MARRKLKLAYIADNNARKATYKKRKQGLMKKVMELAILCDIKVCAIIYSPYDPEPVVWPSQEGVHGVLAQVNNMSSMNQSNKMFNQETFLEELIVKAQKKLKNRMKETRKKEMEQLMFQCLKGKSVEGFMLEDLKDLSKTIDEHVEKLQSRMKNITEEGLIN